LKKGRKSKAIALTFRPFLATFFIFEKGWSKKWQKVRLYIASTFRPFLTTIFILEKGAKNKALALPFRPFFALF
jgi:hypothetical protein